MRARRLFLACELPGPVAAGNGGAAGGGAGVLRERVVGASGATNDIEFVWGPDLSGSFHGAGGIGGLLAVSVDGQYYFPFYDQIGNVLGYADETGAVAAAYDYDAFGNILSSTGPLAAFFRHRFSTKLFDPDTGLCYYGYRWYFPAIGRWISRDPIEERGPLPSHGNATNLPRQRNADGFRCVGEA